MKHYVVITPFFPEPDSFRGPYVLDQVKAIVRNSDYNVIVMKPCPILAMKGDYEYDGINVYRFKDYSIPSNMWPNGFNDILTSRSMVAKLKSIGVDINDIAIVHAHVTKQGAYANYLKKLNPQIKTVVQHHGFDVMSITDGKLAKKKFHERQCIRYGVSICNQADLNIGVSQKTLDYLLQQPGICLKNQYVLYNGVDTNVFTAKSSKQQENREKEVFTIGCVGNFWELKDQMTLIKAIELIVNKGIKNIRTIFIGTGYTLANCKKYVTEHQLDEYFEFRTEVMHDELPAFYHSLNLFVLPSYWEAFGCVYTEAYACGVPFIGVKGQGIAEIISQEDKDRWLIDKGDNKKLSELISMVYKSDGCIQKLCIPYSIDQLMAIYLNYIQKL